MFIKKININQDPCLSTEIDKAIRKANSQILKTSCIRNKVIILAENERALLFKDNQFIKVLEAGYYRC